MKTALRWLVMGVMGVVGVAAAPHAAYAVSPMSNGVGDGEANVPFASVTTADEGAGRARPDRARDAGDRAKVAGRSGRAAGRRAPPASGADRDTQSGADSASKELIWTAP